MRCALEVSYWIRALRLIPVVLVLIASYWNISAALIIRQFGRLVLDTNCPLSPAGRLLLDHAAFFLICAVALPLAAVAVMFLRGNVRPLLVGIAIFAISAEQYFFTIHTMVRTSVGLLVGGRPSLSR